jgi:flagellar hook-length control protein FliK
MHSVARSFAPISGSSNDDNTTSSDDVAGLPPSLATTLTVTAPASGPLTRAPAADSVRQPSFVARSGTGDSSVPSSPGSLVSTTKGGLTSPVNDRSSTGWRIRPDDKPMPTTELATDQTEPSTTVTGAVDAASGPGQTTFLRGHNDASAISGRVAAPQASPLDQLQGNANSASAASALIPPNMPDGNNIEAPVGPAAFATNRMPAPAVAALSVAASSVAMDPHQTPQTAVVTAIGPVAGAAPVDPTATATAGSTDTGTGVLTGEPASFGEAMANHVLSMVSAGYQEATLQLQPPQLGELTIRVAVQGRDVSAWFGTAQPQVQVAVTQALDQLRTDLAGAGLNLAGTWVGADASGMRRETFIAATPSRRANFAPSIDSSPVDGNDAARSSGVNLYV